MRSKTSQKWDRDRNAPVNVRNVVSGPGKNQLYVTAGKKEQTEFKVYRKTGLKWEDTRVKAKSIAIGISGRLHTIDKTGRIYWPACDTTKKTVLTHANPHSPEGTTNMTIIFYAIGIVLCLVSCILIPILLLLLSRT